MPGVDGWIWNKWHGLLCKDQIILLNAWSGSLIWLEWNGLQCKEQIILMNAWGGLLIWLEWNGLNVSKDDTQECLGWMAGMNWISM